MLLGAGASLAILANVLPIILIYALMSVAYTAKLKTMPLVDVFMLAGLYTIRLFGGGRPRVMPCLSGCWPFPILFFWVWRWSSALRN